MKNLTEKQEKKCSSCYGLKVDFFPFCSIYKNYIKSKVIVFGDKCPSHELIREDLERSVLGYETVFGNVAKKLMERAPKE